MAKSNRYSVPTPILASQGRKTASLYLEDTEENKALLAGVGADEALFVRAGDLGNRIGEMEQQQEILKDEAKVEKTESVDAAKKVMTWRNERVMPRLLLALSDDRRLAYFRPGRIRSTRSPLVLHEGELLVDAMERYAHLPELKRRGITRALIDEGKALIADARQQDIEAETAAAVRSVATEELYDTEAQLCDVLAEIEACAAAVFPKGSAALKRYRMNEIRGYIAQQRGQGEGEVVDPTAGTNVADPELA